MVAYIPPSSNRLLDLPYDGDEMGVSLELLRRGANAFAVHSLFQTMRMLGLMRATDAPDALLTRVTRNLAYVHDATRDQRLDVWQPAQPSTELRPVVLYIHGGGFRILSKDTHWMMGRAFAERGYVTFNVNYRLGPEHPYPTPLQDVASALRWVHANAHRFGGDASRIVLAGESAGANLALSLGMLCSYKMEQPWAKALYSLNIAPRAIISACGLLQTSRPERFEELGTPAIARAAIRDACHTYLPPDRIAPAGDQLDLASPLLTLETRAPDRALPPIFAPVGTRDPLIHDTERLGAALDKLGSPYSIGRYEGSTHSFMAFMWTAQSKRCWGDIFAFLDQHAPITPRRAIMHEAA